MDDSNEGILLIAASMITMLAFAISVLAVMMIYHRRKKQHHQEISALQEKFEHERLQTQLEVKTQTMAYIGAEIHDNVNQKLSIAKMLTQQLANSDAAGLESKTNELKRTIDQCFSDLRNLTHSLDPSRFSKLDLAELLRAECRQIQATGIHIEYTSNTQSLHCSDSTKLFAFRIFQEFLQNAIRHSGCTAITVMVHQHGNGIVEIGIADNGKGFILSAVDDRSGSGLRNMEKRAKFIGAQFQLESTAGRGTSMKLILPP